MLPADLSLLKVVELRAELSNRDLPTKGKKDELVERLQAALDAPAVEEPVKEEPVVTKTKLVNTEKTETVVLENAESLVTAEKTQSIVIEKTESPVENAELPVAEKTTVEEITVEKIEPPTNETDTVKEAVAETPAIKESAPVETSCAEQSSVELPAVKETAVETPATADKSVAIETPAVEKTVGKTSTMKKPAAVETPAEKKLVAEAPIAEIPNPVESIKENMDTDRNTKRKRSVVPERTQEKRVRVDLESSALYIKGFVRPLIIRSVNELFAQYGTVKRFWMDSIKTHCYVTYETVEEAKTAYENINGIVFPKDTGKALSVGGLTPEQVEQLIEYEQSAAERRLRVDWEASVEKVKLGGSLPSSSTAVNTRKARSIGIGQIAKQLAQAAEPVVTPSRQVEIVRPPKERTLEDLFCKTKTLPHLYYLPNSEEEAKNKLSQIQSL